MYTVPADESSQSFHYKTIMNASLIQQLANIPNNQNISGASGAETPAIILQEMNQLNQHDMDDVFARELEQITDQEQMEAKAAEHNREYQRMLVEQRLEEERQTMAIEYMKEKEKSQDEIRTK